MSTYTDLFVVPVPTANIAAYRQQAELFVTVWREHGALSCIEVEADDAPVGKVAWLWPVIRAARNRGTVSRVMKKKIATTAKITPTPPSRIIKPDT